MAESNFHFAVSFEDGSTMTLPKDWEDVFVDYFGENPAVHANVAELLRFLVGKYVEHRAWPSKFDGIGLEIEEDSKYDDRGFYFEHWSDWGEIGRKWGGQKIYSPTWAEIAEAVLYQSMRVGIFQKALDTYAKSTGSKAPRVLTPEQFLQELNHQNGTKDT